MEPRRTVFVIFDGFQPLDMVGPHEVFSHAAGLGGGYACEVVATSAGLVRSASGLPVHAAGGVAGSGPGGVDTLVIAGGTGVDQACHDEPLVSWIAAAGAGARRVTSVCTGVFLLAAAGIGDLAGQAGLSPRHLQRRFTAEVGTPPAAYVERVRIEAAQRALTGTDDPVDTIARRCGFGTAETLRRAFHRHARIAPADYRTRFRSTRELT